MATGADNEDLETKQTYVHQYENMQISTVLHPTDIKTENAENAGLDTISFFSFPRVKLQSKGSQLILMTLDPIFWIKGIQLLYV